MGSVNIAGKRVRCWVAGAGVVGWTSLTVLTVLDLARERGTFAPPGWYALMISAGAVSMSATISALLLHVMPAMYVTWRDGIDYGRRCEREDQGLDDPVPTVTRLRSVR